MTRLVFYGSSLLSSYWNGAATYYRGILEALASLGYAITFYEPDAFDRQAHRDMDKPDWAEVVVYPATETGLQHVLRAAEHADIVVKASGVGVFDHELLDGMLSFARTEALKIFWDVDAPATLATLQNEPDHILRRKLASLDIVLTYGGGPPVIERYRALGAKDCVPIYNALNPATHFPAASRLRPTTDLGFLANRLPDREARVDEFFLSVARRLPEKNFVLGGAGWDSKPLAPNVNWIGHVPTGDHNSFNASSVAVLNVAREDMAAIGYSPATRVFEAAGAASCIITDAWTGIESFFQPGTEILVARDGKEVAEHLQSLTPERAQQIGKSALARCLAQHTYTQRAADVHSLLQALLYSPARLATA